MSCPSARIRSNPSYRPALAHAPTCGVGVGLLLPMNTYAVDFETYYDSECSITTLGPKGYFSHPDFDAYMVTVVGDDGYEFVGSPKDFNWSMLDGHLVLSHNASFDESLYLHGVQNNWWAGCTPAAWHCTADMTAFLGLPRSLKKKT